MADVVITARTTGDVQLAAKLGMAGPKAKRLAGQVVSKSTYDCQRIAKENAAVDTGFMRNAITAQVFGMTGVVEATANYSIHQEFGTYKMRAHPFMGPARKAVTPGFVAAMAQVPRMSLR